MLPLGGGARMLGLKYMGAQLHLCGQKVTEQNVEKEWSGKGSGKNNAEAIKEKGEIP